MQLTTTAGRRAHAAFQMLTASAYPGSPGLATIPLTCLRSPSTASLVMVATLPPRIMPLVHDQDLPFARDSGLGEAY